MRIAFDLVAVERLDDGIYTSSQALLQGLRKLEAEHHYLVLTARPERYADLGQDARFELVRVPMPSLRRHAVLFEHQVLEPLTLRKLQPDIVHTPGLASPRFWHGPIVLTLHDLGFLHLPEQMSRASLYYWRYLVLPGARRATRIVTVSQYARQEIAHELHLPLERIETVYNSIGEQFQATIPPEEVARTRATYHLSERYLLFVGTLQARKNLGALVRAFERLAPEMPDVQLVLAGGYSANGQEILRQVEQSPQAPRIRVTGRIADEDLPALYAGAQVVVMPSKHEGFGLPMIEAMACGTPVVANNASSLPEVAGDAALLTDADEPEVFATALRSALENGILRADLIAKGCKRAAQFRPEVCARSMIEVYERAFKSKHMMWQP